jgi:hypothetical protein
MGRKTTDELVTIIRVEVDKAVADLKKVDKAQKKFADGGAKGFANLKSSALAATAALAGTIAVTKKLVALAAEQERVEKRLAFAVKAAGIETGNTTQELIKFAGALQRQTIFGDEAIINIQTMLVQLGRLSGEELNRATELTLDFASAMGVDLKAAAVLMGKAAAGSTEALSRYGIVLDKNIPKNEKFTTLLDIMQEKFGGTSKTDTTTLFGSIEQTKNSFGDLGEELGRMNSGVLKTSIKFWGNLAAEVADSLANVRSFQDQSIAATLEREIASLQKQLQGESFFDEFGNFISVVLPTGDKANELLAQIIEKRKILNSLSEEQLGRGGPPLIPPAPAETAKPTAGLISSFGIMQDEEGNIIVDDSFVGAWQKRNEIAREQAALAIEVEAEGQEISRAQFQYFEEEKTRIAREQSMARVEAAKMGFQALSTLFPKVKAFAIGEAIISTHQAITNALATKPFVPSGLAMAALAAAKGAASIRAIQGASPGGGRGAISGAVGGATSSLPVQGETNAPNVTVVVKGKGIENLIEDINVAVEDNNVRLVSSDSLTSGVADSLR